MTRVSPCYCNQGVVATYPDFVGDPPRTLAKLSSSSDELKDNDDCPSSGLPFALFTTCLIFLPQFLVQNSAK